MQKKNILNTLILLTSIILSLVLVEIFLRILGHTTFKYSTKPNNEPVTNVYNKDLGWRPKVGIFQFEPWSNEGKLTTLTSSKNGRVDKIDNPELQRILFLGGSFTQGFAVNDNETFIFNLQEKFKNFNLENYGVGGYGTYQNLILLRKLISENKDIKMVIYGYVEHHDVRNIAQDSWLKMLFEYSKRGAVELPYVSLNQDQLEEHKSVKYQKLPLSESSALIHFIEKKLMYFFSYKRYKNRYVIRNKVIEEMNHITSKNNIDFINLFLHTSDSNKRKMINYFNEEGIQYADCNLKKFKSDMIVKGEGHPNSKTHFNWSQCLESFFKNNDMLLKI